MATTPRRRYLLHKPPPRTSRPTATATSASVSASASSSLVATHTNPSSLPPLIPADGVHHRPRDSDAAMNASSSLLSCPSHICTAWTAAVPPVNHACFTPTPSASHSLTLPALAATLPPPPQIRHEREWLPCLPLSPALSLPMSYDVYSLAMEVMVSLTRAEWAARAAVQWDEQHAFAALQHHHRRAQAAQERLCLLHAEWERSVREDTWMCDSMTAMTTRRTRDEDMCEGAGACSHHRQLVRDTFTSRPGDTNTYSEDNSYGNESNGAFASLPRRVLVPYAWQPPLRDAATSSLSLLVLSSSPRNDSGDAVTMESTAPNVALSPMHAMRLKRDELAARMAIERYAAKVWLSAVLEASAREREVQWGECAARAAMYDDFVALARCPVRLRAVHVLQRTWRTRRRACRVASVWSGRVHEADKEADADGGVACCCCPPCPYRCVAVAVRDRCATGSSDCADSSSLVRHAWASRPQRVQRTGNIHDQTIMEEQEQNWQVCLLHTVRVTRPHCSTPLSRVRLERRPHRQPHTRRLASRRWRCRGKKTCAVG